MHSGLEATSLYRGKRRHIGSSAAMCGLACWLLRREADQLSRLGVVVGRVLGCRFCFLQVW